MATALSRSLPKPKYTGEDEELETHAKSRGPRVVGAGVLDESQIVLKKTGPPPYGNRAGWRPRSAEDFGDGGAFPEIPVAQYPLDMGRKQTSSSNALALQVDAEGKVKYDAIARRGHDDKRVIHSQFKDLIPLRQRADAGDLSLERPSEEEIAATRERTQMALTTLINGAVAAQKPKNVQGTSRPAPTYVSYTPDNQMGDQTAGNTRIIKIVQRHQDPVEPPKHKHKKVPRGPPSPPPPVMHSPPRKLTAEDQEMWKIPPPVSNWKNAKGYTVPLDKRLAADGRGLQDVTINDKFAQFSEALSTADRHAREEVKQRALMQQKLAEKEKMAKEEHLRSLAQRARQDRANAGQRRMSSRRSSSPAGSRSRSASYSSRSYSRSRSPDSGEEARKQREKARRERNEENERKLRQSHMGTERRLQQMARAQNRDIGEKVALGLAKPTQTAESMYDSRLFNQTSGFDTGFNEDQAYDKPLFAQRAAIDSIYRPNMNQEDDEEDASGETMDKIQKQGHARFGEALGRGGFKGSEAAERRDGPVQFEVDKNAAYAGDGKTDDPFGIDDMINEAKGNAEKGGKRYGIQESEGRASKRARVEDDD